jgi:hypothetical protein
MVLCSGLALFKLEFNVKRGLSTLFLTPNGVIRLLLFTNAYYYLTENGVFTAYDRKYYTAKFR